MSKSALSPIEKVVRNNLDKYFSTPSDLYFVVGVSGGVDSMSLLYAFKKLGVNASAVHVNYQKRGKASDKDAELVKRVVSEWGFESHIAEVPPSEAEGYNFQQWAREYRYDLFNHFANAENADGIAVAHHEDDQVETILQKIFRGAGLASWTGMKVWDGNIFRPLLQVSRTQIERYAKENSIPYRTDESNLKSNFARNLLRNEWLEKLSDFFPGWKKNVLRINEQANNYEKAITWISNRIMDEKGIKRKPFLALDPGLQKALILHLLKQRDPGLQISHDNLSRVEELLDLQTGKEIQLTLGFSLIRDRTHYVIEEDDKQDFQAAIFKRDKLKASSVSFKGISLSIESYQNPNFGNALYLDVDKISWPITIRRWHNGDRFQPFGMKGHQQVSDHLTNRKVSAVYKEEALVIESFEDTICAIIFPPIKNQSPPGTISEQMKCDADTKYCLKIRYRK